MTTIERPVLRYFGGKWRIAPWIIENFPIHDVYVEPFGGGASVLMRKERSKTEVYNDLDEEIVNVFRMMRCPKKSKELKRILKLTLFSRSEFDLAHEITTDPVERARRTITRSFMGHGADSTTRKQKSGFRAKSFKSNRDASKDWKNYYPCIDSFCERLEGCIIENNDAMKVIDANDSPKTLFYLDPPYVFKTRVSAEKHGYRHEMTDDDHMKFLEKIKTLKGMVILSGYESDLYDSLGWEKIKKEALADGAKKRTEILWMNPLAIKNQPQERMF